MADGAHDHLQYATKEGLEAAVAVFTTASTNALNEINGLKTRVVKLEAGTPVTPPTGDKTPPTAPTDLKATVQGVAIVLNWNASSDNVDVIGYRVYRNGVQIFSVTGRTATDTTAVVGVAYNYTVAAIDAAGNLSPQSAIVPIAIPAAPSTNVTAYAPFSSDSPWNTPAPAPNNTYNTAIRAALKGGGLGINIDQYSVPVYIATLADPMVTIIDVAHNNKKLQIRVPAGAVPAVGTDGNMAIIQPDGRTVDVWIAKWINSTTIEAQRLAVTSLTGKGVGPAVNEIPAGIRAFEGSTLGGLIRAWEVDPTHPNYKDGVIRHALAMAMPSTFYKYTGQASNVSPTDSHFTTDGYGTSLGYVAPATAHDWDAQWVYKGSIPLGTRFRIPASVNIDSIGLTSEAAKQVARALQTYGCYVVDKTDNDGWWGQLYGEPSINNTAAGKKWSGDAMGADWQNFEKMRQQLVSCPKP